jgi:thioesterase domain-containing protein/acyl carrier protein
VGGVQVARGYLGRPALTAERFLPDPYSGRPGARMYGTGDRVRRLSDGALEFLGRADDQVKVRGFRVEPGEVEAALLAHPEVREAAVVAGKGPGGETRLAGYFVAAGDAVDAAALREHLRDRVPEYMVPAALVRLDALPLTSNGKTDRRALPPAEAYAPDYVAPRDPVEEALAAAWAEVRVGVRDDFFELGGHSLSAARLVARIRERLGREVSLADLFRGATVERLARSLQGGAGPELPPSLVRLRDGRGTPFFCVHAAGGMAAAYLRLARRLDDRPFYGVQARGLAPGESPDGSVEEMAARYLEAIRKAQPRGPYLLGGWSVGGTVAWEVARRLRDAGEEVALLALVDSWAPVGGARPLPDDADLFALLAADLGVSTEPATLTRFRDELRALPPDARLARFGEWIRQAEPGLPGLDGDELGRRLAVYRATARAAADYGARPCAVPVTLFRATRSAAWPSGDLSPEAWEGDPRLRWRELTAGELDVRQVPGTHHSIVVGEDVEGLAAALRSALAAVAPA